MAKYLFIFFTIFVLAVPVCYSGETFQQNKDNFQMENVEGAKGTLTQIRALSVREKRQDPSSAAYYDFLINEGSFKFWAVFQVVTIAILFYSTFAAIYYAKYTYLHEDPDEEDAALFLRSGRTNRRIERIVRAVHTPPA